MAQIPKGRLVKGPHKPICRHLCHLLFNYCIYYIYVSFRDFSPSSFFLSFTNNPLGPDPRLEDSVLLETDSNKHANYWPIYNDQPAGWSPQMVV